VFTKANTDVTIPLCAELLIKNKVKYCRVETNSMGAMFMRYLKKQLPPSVNLLGVNSSTNKDTRIFMNSDFVLRKFVFSDTTIGQYNQFKENLKNYSSEGKNKNDDAPDAVTGLAIFVQGMFPKLDA
jgi:predicted phage terminase large subunit-like protein